LNTGKFRNFLKKIQKLAVPPKATVKWLESIGYTSKNDRDFLRVLQKIDFLDGSRVPTDNYKDFINVQKSKKTMAKCIKKGYSFLYKLFPEAHKESSDVLVNAFQREMNVKEDTAKIAERTFRVLCEFADFDALEKEPAIITEELKAQPRFVEPTLPIKSSRELIVNINVQITLPTTEKAEVYDKIFEALKKHFFNE